MPEKKNALDGALDQVQVEDAARAAVGGIVDGFVAAREAESIRDDDVISPEKQTFSLGYASVWLQVSPNDIRAFMKLAGVKFAGSHNDVPFLDAHGVRAVARAMKEALAKVEA